MPDDSLINLTKSWVEALRSDTYPQCKYKLMEGSGYCCLGVLVKITPGFELIDEMLPSGVKFQDEFICLLDEFPENHPLFEFITSFTKNSSKTRVEELVNMNDDLDMNFLEIADHIEKNLLPLLTYQMAMYV